MVTQEELNRNRAEMLRQLTEDDAPKREETMFLDRNGAMIYLGDVVKAPVDVNQDTHGSWALYQVRKAPGGYIMSYLKSERGQVLPEGYTGGYMHEVIPKQDEKDLKTLVFTKVPVRIHSWVVIKYLLP